MRQFVVGALTGILALVAFWWNRRTAAELENVTLDLKLTAHSRRLPSRPEEESIWLLEATLQVKNISQDAVGLLAAYAWAEALDLETAITRLKDDARLMEVQRAERHRPLALTWLLGDAVHYLQPGESEQFIQCYLFDRASAQSLPELIAHAEIYCAHHQSLGVGVDHGRRRHRFGRWVQSWWPADSYQPALLRR